MAGGWPLAAVIAFQPYCAECCATTRSRYPAVTPAVTPEITVFVGPKGKSDHRFFGHFHRFILQGLTTEPDKTGGYKRQL